MADSLHDFSNPVMAAAVVKADGTRIPLWVQTDAEALDVPEILTVTDITVEIGLGYIPKISAPISLPFEDLIKLLDFTAEGKGITWLQDTIEVQFGYVGANGKAVLSPVHSGFLTKPEVSAGVDSSVGLTGIGTPGWSASRQGRGKAFQQLTRFEVIEQLARGVDPAHPRRLVVNDSLIKPYGEDPAFQALYVDKVSYAPGYTSDLHMIFRVAKEAFCWVRFETLGNKDTLTLIPYSNTFGSTPRHRFQMFGGGSYGPGNGLYPIFQFNSPTTGVYYATETRGKFLASINSKTGNVEAAFYGDEDPKGAKPANRSGGGGGQPEPSDKTPEPDMAQGEGAANASADQVSPQVVSRLRAEAQRSLVRGMGVRVEIETLGVPDLLPGAMIQVVGMSQLCSYNYCVHNITHTLGGGGYSSSIVAYSNSGAVQRAVAQKVAGSLVNDPAPIEEEGGSTAQGSAG